MPVTRTTFPKGNGAGVGGAAKGGKRPAFTPDNQPSPEEKAAGHDVAKEIRERIAERRHAILAAEIERAVDVNHPQGHSAAHKLLERLSPTVAKQEISGPDGGPQEIVRRIIDPASD